MYNTVNLKKVAIGTVPFGDFFEFLVHFIIDFFHFIKNYGQITQLNCIIYIRTPKGELL